MHCEFGLGEMNLHRGRILRGDQELIWSTLFDNQLTNFRGALVELGYC
jgi:hypothetical protein